MELRNDDDGMRYIWKCDRCGKVTDEGGTDQRTFDLYYDEMRKIDAVWEAIFMSDHGKWHRQRRQYPECLTMFDLCAACKKGLVPVVHRLRDIDELNFYIRKLKGAINAKKRDNKNNGSIA